MEVSQAITRQSASNLAMAFILLPKSKREGMSALYAFCREIDDIADEETRPVEERRAQLARWREDIGRACRGELPELAVNRELQPIIQRHRLPFELFEELIRGVEMDLSIHRYPNFAELELYCYRVASVVGLLSIEIFGYKNPACRQYAIALGKALQLTNILRDVRTDAARGRIYLPLSELEKFQVAPEEILHFQYSERYARLSRRVASVAREFYRQAQQMLPAKDRRSMASAELMGSVYWRLLEELEHRQFNVFDSPPARLSKAEKLFLVFRTWYRVWRGALSPNYGVG